jgi:stage II sporulation protein AA (anti-sigma F factor antagonist)
MQIGEEKCLGVLVVAPLGRVDSTTASALEQVLLARVGSGERRVVMDMAGIDYISSAGLRVFLRLAKKLKELGGGLAMGAMGEPVRQVFELAGFLPLFTIEPSRELALARLGPDRPTP